MIKLNLGCGSVRPQGWINTDSSINANIQRIPLIGKLIARLFSSVEYNRSNIVYMNLNKKWSYDDNSIDIIYASHLFEHLSLRATDVFLKEAYRTLKPGGVMRIVVPDLFQISKKYVEEYEKSDSTQDTTKFVMWAINMHREGQYGDPNLFKKLIYEYQGYPHQHKYMYDSKSLTYKVLKYGFKYPLLLEYGLSENIEEIKDVEGSKESYLSVYLEIKK
jgi:predicted SAM-dependent methyltransferase